MPTVNPVQVLIPSHFDDTHVLALSSQKFSEFHLTTNSYVITHAHSYITRRQSGVDRKQHTAFQSGPGYQDNEPIKQLA